MRIKAHIIFLILIICCGRSFAQIPRTIHIQGQLLSAGLAAADGEHSITISLYDARQSGTLLYSETQKVQTMNGLFSATLGSVTPLPQSLTFSDEYFAGVAFDGNPEEFPTTAFTSAPYALHAGSANGLTEHAHIPQNLFTLSSTPGGFASGDLGGYYPAPIVSKIRGEPVTPYFPDLYDRLRWDGKMWQLYHMPMPNTFLVYGDTVMPVTKNSSAVIHFFSDSANELVEDSNYVDLTRSHFLSPDSGLYEFSSMMQVNSSISDSSKTVTFLVGFTVNDKLKVTSEIAKLQFRHEINLEFTSSIRLTPGDRVRFILALVDGTGIFTLKRSEMAGLKMD